METMEKDTLILGGKEFHSRFILGSGKFSLQLIRDVMQYGGSEIATIALRRAKGQRKQPEAHHPCTQKRQVFPLHFGPSLRNVSC